MADGFHVTERIAEPPEKVWAYLTDFGNATAWMTGIDDMTQATEGPVEIGTTFSFKSRGKERESRVTAFVPGRSIALTSTQGGVTATYAYSLAPADGGTEMALDAQCTATGFWRLIHPIIVFAMRKSDSSHLTNLKAAMKRSG